MVVKTSPVVVGKRPYNVIDERIDQRDDRQNRCTDQKGCDIDYSEKITCLHRKDKLYKSKME